MVECKRQGDSRVMAWCGMVDGRMLAVKWMVDENGRPHSVTSQCYQEMLQQHVWPEGRNQSSRQNCWFLQDVATSLTTELNINILIKKGHLLLNAVGAQLATIKSGSQSS